jgi:hypothetical protein
MNAWEGVLAAQRIVSLARSTGKKTLKLGGVMLFCLDGLDDVDVDLDANLESLILLYIAYSLWLHLYGTNLRHGFSL